MPTTLDFVQSNLARARELRNELRSIDEAATAAQRSYTAAEQATATSHAAEIQSCEARADANLDLTMRGQAISDGSGGLIAGAGTQVRQGERQIGAIPPVRFDDAALRSLHEHYLDRSSHSISAVETRDVVAPVMASVPTYLGGVVTARREPTRVAGLMPVQNVDHATARYYVGSVPASAAAPVAEGAVKPESDPAWTAVDVAIRKLAHYTDVTTEALADYANFEQVVRDELTAGLVNVENVQLLSGSGTAPAIRGLLNVTGIQVYAPAAAEERYLSILRGITMLRTGTSYTEPDVILLHPSDMEKVLTAKDTTNGLIVSPNPSGAAASSLWGVPIVVTTGLTAGTGIVANLAEGSVVFSREAPRIMVDPYSQSANNLVRFICEERIALGSPRPSAVVKITFNP